MTKRILLVPLIVLFLASCDESRSAGDDFQGRFNLPLPKGTNCSAYHTSFESENDWVYALEFQDEAQSRAFRSKWGLSKGISGQGEIFKRLSGIIAGTQFEKGLLRGGWSILPQSYDGYEGKTKTGRDSYVYLSADGRRMLVVVLGG